MAIITTCTSCGKQFRVGDEFAGKKVSCAGCGKPTTATGPQVAPYDAFVSYSSKDKPVADAMVATLEADGIRCWVAPRDIVPGTEWSEAIIDGIQKSRMVVLVFSAHSNASQQVLREVERAVNRGMPIVPFRIENLLPSRGMEYFISASHWLDAYHPPLDDHLRKLSATARALLDGQGAPKMNESTNLKGRLRAAVKSLAARDNRTRALVAAAVLLLLVGGMFAAAIYGMKDPKASPEIVKAKADAEMLVDSLRKLDPGQGIQARQQEIDNDLKSGESFYADKNYSKAQEAFSAVLSKGRELEVASKQRDEAAAVRSQMNEAKATAVKNNAARLMPQAWAAAEQHAASGTQAFESGDFNGAAEKWQLARTGYSADFNQVAAVSKAFGEFEAMRTRPRFAGIDVESPEEYKAVSAASAAAEQAAHDGRYADAIRGYQEAKRLLYVIALPRLKALAFHAGFECRRVAITALLNSSGGSTLGLKIPNFKPPPKLDSRSSLAILKKDLWPKLELKSEFLTTLEENKDENLDQLEPNYVLNRTIWEGIYPQIRRDPELGSPVEKAYLLGNNAAFCLTLFTVAAAESHPAKMRDLLHDFRLIMKTWANNVPRTGVPAAELESLMAMRENCVNDIIKPLETGKTNLFLLGGEWATLLLKLKLQLDRSFGDVATATQTFRKGSREGMPLPAEATAVAHLRSLGAVLSFEDVTKPSPVVSAYLFGPVPEPRQTAAALRELSGLRTLSLGGNAFTDEDIASLVGLTKLRELSLAKTKSTDASLVHLQGMVELEQLYASGTAITDGGLANLHVLAKLRELEVEDTKVTADGAASLRKVLPRVRVVPFTVKESEAEPKN